MSHSYLLWDSCRSPCIYAWGASQDQGFVERSSKNRYLVVTGHSGQIDFSDYDTLRQQKLRELNDIQNYALHHGCSMTYLTTYLGDALGPTCGVCGWCQPANFPPVEVSENLQNSAARFLEEEYLLRIEKRGSARAPAHEAGWALSGHGASRIGRLVRACKYENAGPFPLSLVVRAIEVLYTRYPITEINGIVSVPPTRSGTLVEDFARQVAVMVNREYFPVLIKIRETLEHGSMYSLVQSIKPLKSSVAH